MMWRKAKAMDLTGKTFGRWTVIGRAANPVVMGVEIRDVDSSWHVRCECGKLSIAQSAKLRHGKSTQCRTCSCRKNLAKARASRRTVPPSYSSKSRRFWYNGKRIRMTNHFKSFGVTGVSGLMAKVDTTTHDGFWCVPEEQETK